MAIYARKGERAVTPDGRYLCTLARDLDGNDRWYFDDFEDCQIDIRRAGERLPLTAWLTARLRAA